MWSGCIRLTSRRQVLRQPFSRTLHDLPVRGAVTKRSFHGSQTVGLTYRHSFTLAGSASPLKRLGRAQHKGDQHLLMAVGADHRVYTPSHPLPFLVHFSVSELDLMWKPCSSRPRREKWTLTEVFQDNLRLRSQLAMSAKRS